MTSGVTWLDEVPSWAGAGAAAAGLKRAREPTRSAAVMLRRTAMIAAVKVQEGILREIGTWVGADGEENELCNAAEDGCPIYQKKGTARIVTIVAIVISSTSSPRLLLFCRDSAIALPISGNVLPAKN